jgi:hypothetical protein
MPSFRETFLEARNEARAARGAPPLGRDQGNAGAADDRYDAAGDVGGHSAAKVAQLEDALQQRADELLEIKRLLAEMADYAELMEARVIELIAGAEPMAKALLLPGVKTFLLQRFHPDKYPDAGEKERELLTNALKTINAAYSRAGELQTADSSSPPSE